MDGSEDMMDTFDAQPLGMAIAAPLRRTVDTARDALAILQSKAAELIVSTRREIAGGSAAYPPEAGPYYDAFCLRDFAYMLDGCPEAIPETDLREAFELFLAAQRSDGAVPNCIRFDGTPLFQPGDGSMGANPVADGSQFLISVAWHVFNRIGDRQLIRNAMPRLIQAMEAIPRNPRTGLVTIDPVPAWDRCPYGFTDTVHKKGDVFFASLLFVQAAEQLADLLQSIGREGDADMWQAEGQLVAKRIRMYFWDKRVGLFRAASHSCREHDVWGSAFAVQLAVATSGQLMSIASYLRTHYDEITMRGQVRHLPADTYWEKCDTPRGTYQNGGYWAAPSGWLAYALDIVDPALADRVVLDLTNDFLANGIYECLDEDGIGRVPDYVASVTLPISGIKRMLARREKRESDLELALLAG